MFTRNIPEWCKYFDRIFLINLRSRKDRLKESVKELKKYNIPFMRYEATYDEYGAFGLFLTMIKLFEYCLKNDINKIVVFEDDIHFLQDPTNTMNAVITHIPNTWDLIYLGCNLPVPVVKESIYNWITVKNAYSTHAVCYNRDAMKTFIRTHPNLPYDVMLINDIQQKGNSYCTYPMLASQRANWSDIEKKFCDYSDFLEKRFNQNVKIQT